MKIKSPILIVISLFFFINTKAQDSFNLPFIDNFEETITNDAVFKKWTTENLSGWQYWHLIFGGGNGGQCLRFENCDNNQDDWLITKPIDCSGIENIKVNFDILYNGQGPKPELLYTNSYNGNSSESNWTTLNYTLGPNEGIWHSVGEIVFTPGSNVLYLAFHYESVPDNALYCLLDNFSIKGFKPVVYVKTGETDHFEFYTNIKSESDYWLQIKDALENNYKKYSGHWNVPGLKNFMDENIKTKVYYTEEQNIEFTSSEILNIKSGSFNRSTYSIFLSPLNYPEKQSYYGTLEGLAVNTFAAYAVKHRIIRDGLEDYLPPYFIEGFGLYEQGYRPNRDSVISYLERLPQHLTHNDFLSFRNFHATSEKDILTAYFEWSALFCGYKGIYWQYGTFPETFRNFLYYFYTCSDTIQIKKRDQSENFDIYCSVRDTMYTDSMKVWLERTRAFYIDSFQMDINVRYPLLLMYDEKTGMDLTGYDDFNGGSASICISPNSFWSGLDGYNWLLAHEFGHIFNSLMYSNFPSGFHHEGMANLSGFYMDGGAHLDDQWKIEAVFENYQKKYHREPTLDEFITDPDGLIDCYYFGFEFFRFLIKHEGHLKIKEFFNNGLDWTVFTMSYEEIEEGFKEYLWQINAQRDYNEPEIIQNAGISVPKGASKIITSSNLQGKDNEIDDTKLFYIIETYPTMGELVNLDKPGVMITRFSESDLKANKIQYINTSNESYRDYFTFTLTDGTFFPSNIRFNIQILDSNYSFTDSSQFFIFYSNLENAQEYWNEISEKADNWYLELCSYWDRPGTPFIFNRDKKTEIILTDDSSFKNQSGMDLPDWKCCFFENEGKIITKLPTQDNIVYENTYSTLVKNILGQYMLNKHFNGNIDQYFQEAFGLYYSGFRPDKEEVVNTLNNLGRIPLLSDIESINNLNTLQQKILFTTYMESKVLQDSYQGLYPGNEALWQNHLKYYYQASNESRMSLHKPSMNFDFYCIPRDTIFLDTIAQRLEYLFDHYTSLFKLDINNRFNVIIFPDKETANGLNGGEYSIGSAHGGDNFNMLSPYLSENSMKSASGGLVAHEFWHVIHFHMRPYNGYPNGQFIMEGMADYMPVGTIDMRTENDLWKIQEVFYNYSSQLGRDPTLKDIMENPQTIEPYLFGQLFFNYLIPNIADYPEVKNFFMGRCDWSAFNFSYEEIDRGYITYLKSLVNYIPGGNIIDIPFEEKFDNFHNGWTTPVYSIQDNWQIDDNGVGQSKCARFYTYSEKNAAIESWLITPALNTRETEKIVFSFEYKTYGNNIELEILYTDNFNGNIIDSDWKYLETLSKTQSFDWVKTNEITIENVPDTFFIGIKYKAAGQQHDQTFIDNFKVSASFTNIEKALQSEDLFKIYPNPLSEESVVSFITRNTSYVNLSVFDIQGRKIATILNEELLPGKYTLPIRKYIKNNGLYYCRLSTENKISTIKLILNKK